MKKWIQNKINLKQTKCGLDDVVLAFPLIDELLISIESEFVKADDVWKIVVRCVNPNDDATPFISAYKKKQKKKKNEIIHYQSLWNFVKANC